MESIMGGMSQRGTTFGSDPTLRRSRQLNPRGPAGQLVQDLGSSGFASNRSESSNKLSAGTRRYEGRVERGSSSSQRKKIVEISDEDSESDELDFLSRASSDNESDKGPLKPITAFQPSSHDPEHQQTKSDVLRRLKFNKKKFENDNAISFKSRMPSSNILESKSPNLSGKSRLLSSTKHSSQSSSQSRETFRSSHKASSKPSMEDVNTRRVRRLIGGDKSSEEGGLGTDFVRGTEGKQKESEIIMSSEPFPSKNERPRPKPLPVKPSSSKSAVSALLKPPAGKLRPAPPAEFPVLASPADTPKNNLNYLLSKPRSFPIPASPDTPKNQPNVLPAAFPLSPNTSQQKKLASKRHRLNNSVGDDDNDKRQSQLSAKIKKGTTVPAAAPFPLNCSQSTSRTGKHAGKRASNASSQYDVSPLKKQRLDDHVVSSSQSLHDSDDSDHDDYFYNPLVDANTLCPYCDESLPSSPTPHLKHLLATTAKKSVRAPRPTNPMGRKAAVSVFINVCQRHRFESKILPEAEAKGWPKSIEWNLIHGRVMRMRKHLEALMENSFFGDTKGDSDDDDSDVHEGGSQRMRVRDKCFFWKEVMKEVKEKGTRAAANVKSQFANFQNAQPGYYGELGSILIHQSLCELFPPETTHPDLVSPLSPKEFINRVLLPEVALRLIMEDKLLSGSSGARKSLEILRDSTTYGVAMFPEDTGERGKVTSAKVEKGKSKGKGKGKGKERHRSEDLDNEKTIEMNVADKMVREKARRRRLELEREDENEQEELIQLEQAAKHSRRKVKGKQKEKESELLARATSSQKPKPKPRPKPKAIHKNASSSLVTTNFESGSEDVPVFSDNDFYINESDVDNALADWAVDDLTNDAFVSTKDNGLSTPSSISGLSTASKQRTAELPPPSSSLKPNSARSTSTSNDDAMDIACSSAEDAGSIIQIRKARKPTIRKAGKMPTRNRSSSIEMFLPDAKPATIPPQPPSSSFDMDDTPKASRPQPSLFSSSVSSTSFASHNSDRNIEKSERKTTYEDTDPELDHWDNDPGSAPLAYIRSRSKPTVPSLDTKRKKNREERSKNNTQSNVKRTDSMRSDSRWLLSDGSNY
ncbi:RTC4-like domain-containing protein [Lentinula aff. detonsa]|nr:RTC4-like domain-containing protein [Lentinula aff. detonsa]